ncbi:MAG: response regulator [Lachnospiraceae bacterium]|nr:response regulator [Lachnospiraceae bacterium]
MRFVTASELKPGMVLARDILTSNSSFFLKKGTELTDKYIKFMQGRGYLGAYIRDIESDDIELEEPPICDETRENAIEAVESMDIERLITAAEQMVAEICKSDVLNMDMVDLRSYDDYTYHHSVNVAVYAVAVGKAMGLPEGQLVQLCEAGLCHDLGKQMIPIEILNKPGRLNEEEWQEIKKHPKFSHDLIADNDGIPDEVKKAVFQHHENENGTGYPKGMAGERISRLAKIVHAADVYDALISKRPYKDPYTPADAMEYLLGGRNILFNEEIVDEMNKVIPTYPSATEVVLNTGDRALVVRQTNDPSRPIVKLKESKLYINLSHEEHTDMYIVASGLQDSGYSREVDILNDARAAAREKSAKIMLVDDSLITLQQTSTALENENYELIALQSGQAAINYVRSKGAPDLIIMDIEMPNIDGIAAVSKIRQMGHPNLPIIFLTAKGDKETVMKCIMMHAKDYIVKPVRPAYLRGRIARALKESLDR